jgi:predicted nucleotidyltransferase
MLAFGMLCRDHIASRTLLISLAIRKFDEANVVATHLFGSLARGEGDPLSDIDLWVTVPDGEIARVVEKRHQIFADIAEIVIFHEAPRNRPLGGSYTLVIHRVGNALIQADYYLAPESTSVILPEARWLSGNRSLPRGQWNLDLSAPVVEDTRERVDFLICMSFIGVKKVLRGDGDFLSFLSRECERFRTTYDVDADPIDSTDDPEFLTRTLQSLHRRADERQVAAIQAVVDDIPRQVRLFGKEAMLFWLR